MKNRYAILYLISGIFIGVLMMWVVQERSVHLSEKQLESLSMLISNNVNSHQSIKSGMQTDTDLLPSSYSADSNDELVARIKSEIATLLTEKSTGKSARVISDNVATEQLISEKTVIQEEYNKAKYLLDDVVNGQSLSFSQFASSEEVRNLPEELKNRIFDEVAVKLNSGELDADSFIGKRD